MQITVQGQKFIIKELANGTFHIVTDDTLGGHYETVEKNFNRAGAWVYEMADNSDIGRKVNHKMCERFGRDFL